MKPATLRPIAPVFAAMMMGATATAAASEEPLPTYSQTDIATCLTEGVTSLGEQTLVQIGLDANDKIVSITGLIAPGNGVALTVWFDKAQQLDMLTAHAFNGKSEATMQALLNDVSDIGVLIKAGTGPKGHDMEARAFSVLDTVGGCMMDMTPQGSNGLTVSLP